MAAVPDNPYLGKLATVKAGYFILIWITDINSYITYATVAWVTEWEL